MSYFSDPVLTAGNSIPPEYPKIGTNSRNGSLNTKHPPVFEDDYLQPRSQHNQKSLYDEIFHDLDIPGMVSPKRFYPIPLLRGNSMSFVTILECQAPTPQSTLDKKDKEIHPFQFSIGDPGRRDFNNPEYFGVNSDDDDEDDEDNSKSDLSNLLLLPHSDSDKRNSMAAFSSSDNSIRTSCTSEC